MHSAAPIDVPSPRLRGEGKMVVQRVMRLGEGDFRYSRLRENPPHPTLVARRAPSPSPRKRGEGAIIASYSFGTTGSRIRDACTAL